MLIIPAVDIKEGHCVRLLQGREDKKTIFSDKPEAMALRWQEEGAELLHVIDLDGAFRKTPQNIKAVKRILEWTGIPVQLGGGIRNMETIKMFLEMGVHRVILGTEAICNPSLVEEACSIYPGRIILGIDARNGMVAIEGWTKTTRIKALDLAKRFENSGLSAIIFTDINKDGTERGPSIEETKRLAESVPVPVIASGGVSSLEDVKNILSLQSSGVVGVVIGRALYTGSIRLREAIKTATLGVKS
nr:1-(5-phosphoribosyl)-5-[(5-phosphoribosylamino)methylideneamino]imidazole-4-carboxamide isomerase [Desulfobacterales bacterium]